MKQEGPEATFQLVVSTFASQAAMALGQLENPMTRKKELDLEQGKFAIDLLEVLKRHTKGNCTPDEETYLDDCLYQLRLVYINASAKK